VAESAHPDANIIFGAVIDDTLGDEVKVTVIAAGFDSGQLPYKKVDVRQAAVAEAPPAATNGYGPAAPVTNGSGRPVTFEPSRPAQPSTAAPGASWTPTATSTATRRAVDLDEELDVPDFLK
jgi:cell division protein FtsZ